MNYESKIDATIAAAIALAQTDEGAAIIESEYAATEHFGAVYKTQHAAALAALADALETYCEPDELERKKIFSVHAVQQADGAILYAADVGENYDMTHTDRSGFAYFIDNDYGFDDSWIEIGKSGSFTLDDFDLSFNEKIPYTLVQAYQIALLSEEVLTPSGIYYSGERPAVVALENEQYLVAMLGDGISRYYAILDVDDFNELDDELSGVNPNDIEYMNTIYKSMNKASVYYSGNQNLY